MLVRQQLEAAARGSSSKRIDSASATSRRAGRRHTGTHTGNPSEWNDLSSLPLAYKGRQILGRERNTTSYRNTLPIARTFIRVENHRLAYHWHVHPKTSKARS